jgi:cytochrome c553
MYKLKLITGAAGGLLMSLAVGTLAAGEKGARLYEHYGCIACHGSGGNAPVDDVVPELAGKKAAYLLEEAQSILSGKSGRDHAGLMHAALYSPQNCDSPPNTTELTEITNWLSKQ